MTSTCSVNGMLVRAARVVSAWAVVPVVILAGLAGASCATASGRSSLDLAMLTVLTCHESPGQQGLGAAPARLVAGLDGFIGDDNPYDSASTPVVHLNGLRYLAWKMALAIAPTARPYRKVSIVRPASARLDYSVGNHAAAPSREVRLPVCGKRYTLYVGGIFVRKPACVELAVSGPGSATAEVQVPVLTAHCPA
jgi:hypothetical protein